MLLPMMDEKLHVVMHFTKAFIELLRKRKPMIRSIDQVLSPWDYKLSENAFNF